MQESLTKWLAGRHPVLLQEHVAQRTLDRKESSKRHFEALEASSKREHLKYEAFLEVLDGVEQQLVRRLQLALDTEQRDIHAERTRRERELQESKARRHTAKMNELRQEIMRVSDPAETTGTTIQRLGPTIERAESQLNDAIVQAVATVSHEPNPIEEAAHIQPEDLTLRLLKHVVDWSERHGDELKRMQRGKITLCKARSEKLAKLSRRYTEGIQGFEQSVLPEMSELIREFEERHMAVLKKEIEKYVGDGRHRTEEVNVMKVSKKGALLRSALCAVHRLWDTLETPDAEREEFGARFAEALWTGGAPAEPFEAEAAKVDRDDPNERSAAVPWPEGLGSLHPLFTFNS